eukprot:15457375-Alexandrium_andersonii.AAC.1
MPCSGELHPRRWQRTRVRLTSALPESHACANPPMSHAPHANSSSNLQQRAIAPMRAFICQPIVHSMVLQRVTNLMKLVQSKTCAATSFAKSCGCA